MARLLSIDVDALNPATLSKLKLIISDPEFQDEDVFSKTYDLVKIC
jgi:hypothetical protein